MRLMLVTGCRIDEIGSLLLKDVQETGESFRITSGKTDNAARYVPVVEAAMSLLAQRYAHANARQQDLPFHERRLFPEWPLKPATGKVNSASQWFTRYRRQALGTDTDTRLTAHSFRHTWRTVARRANVSEDRVKELGGWSGDRETSQIYDHGLPEDILQQTQTKIWQALLDGGFLKTF